MSIFARLRIKGPPLLWSRWAFDDSWFLLCHGWGLATWGEMESDVPAEQLGSALGIENLAKMGPNRKDLGYYK